MNAQIIAQTPAPALAPAAILALINRDTIGQEIRTLRQQCQYNRRELTAINRAALEFTASQWIYDPTTGTLKVESATRLGQWYTIDRNGCTCTAGRRVQPCKHRAMYEAIQRVIARHAAPQQPQAQQPAARRQTDAEYKDMLALVDELC